MTIKGLSYLILSYLILSHLILPLQLDSAQERLKAKEDMIEKKSRELTASQAEKRRADLEVMEVKDQLEVKVSRINSLQRKVSWGHCLTLNYFLNRLKEIDRNILTLTFLYQANTLHYKFN